MNKFKIKFPTKRFAKILLIFACSFGIVAGGYSNVSASGRPPAKNKAFEPAVVREPEPGAPDSPLNYVHNCLGKNLRVELNDGRILTGKFIGMDHAGRIHLKDAEENIAKYDPKNERIVGRELVQIPLNSIAEMGIVPPPSPKACKK